MKTFKKFRIWVIALVVFAVASVVLGWHPTFTYDVNCDTYTVHADPVWEGYPGTITADSGNMSGSWGSAISVSGWIRVKWLDKDGKVLHPESTFGWNAEKPVQQCTPTATNTPTDVPTSTPTPSVTPTEPPVTATLPPPVVVTDAPPAARILMCAAPNTLALADGKYDFYGPTVEVKTEAAFGSIVWFMLSTDQFKEDGIHQVQNDLFRVSIHVNKDAAGQINGYDCELVSAPKIELTATPVPVDCDHVMDGAITCDQEIKAVVLAYCVGNPDPAITITGVDFEQVVRGVVTVNSEPVARVDFWKGNGVVNGKWVYNDIQVGDSVQIDVRFVGLTETYNVPVLEGHECGNPAIQAMIGPNGGLFVYPGQGPEDVKEILHLSSDAEALEIWEEAHRNTQLGIETMLD